MTVLGSKDVVSIGLYFDCSEDHDLHAIALLNAVAAWYEKWMRLGILNVLKVVTLKIVLNKKGNVVWRRTNKQEYLHMYH